MDWWVWLIVAVVAIAVVAVVAGKVMAKRNGGRSSGRSLKSKFGPEYDRTVDRMGDRRDAESELQRRESEREKLDVRPLEDSQRKRYEAEWNDAQARFVDEPQMAVSHADTLIKEVMVARGYPVDGFDQQSSVVSVDHPETVEKYREAHRITLDAKQGSATTEELRQAMTNYRSLFSDLVTTN